MEDHLNHRGTTYMAFPAREEIEDVTLFKTMKGDYVYPCLRGLNDAHRKVRLRTNPPARGSLRAPILITANPRQSQPTILFYLSCHSSVFK